MSELVEIRNDILREMYAESEPPLDFDDVLENPDDVEEGWCNNHTLPARRQRSILNEHLDKYDDVPDSARATLTMECILNLGPAYGDADE